MSRAEAGSGSFKGGGVANVSVRGCVWREEGARAEVDGGALWVSRRGRRLGGLGVWAQAAGRVASGDRV